MGGGDEEDRTPDLRIANATLSQLSYVPTVFQPSIDLPKTGAGVYDGSPRAGNPLVSHRFLSHPTPGRIGATCHGIVHARAGI
jgi:hypothetical protein